MYLAGRAVEGMLRAILWNSDPDYATGRKTLDAGHDLRHLLKLVRNLGVLSDRRLGEAMAADVQRIGRLWWNSMRFLPTAKVKTKWYDLKEIGGKRTLKQASEAYYESCSAVVRRAEALWQSEH